jgi:hypothetical protein
MNTYTVETDGMNGFQVNVVGPDGKIHLTSASLSTWTQAQNWITEHRRNAGGITPPPKPP